MATTFFLVRHASHRRLGDVLVGRMPGVELDKEGRQQAHRLADRLIHERITMVQASPRERAYATAMPIARGAGLAIELAPALDEIDLGEWTGRDFAMLAGDPRWRAWNTARASTRPPGGESMHELQHRVLRHLQSLAAANGDGRVVLVSHAEVIRAALLHCLHMSLDDFARIEIGPASVSTIVDDRDGLRATAWNEAVTP